MNKSLIYTSVALIALLFNANNCLAQSWSLSGNGMEAQDAVLGTMMEIPLDIISNGEKRIRVDESGLVGIGTVSPSHALTIFGNQLSKAIKDDKKGPSSGTQGGSPQAVLQLLNSDSGEGEGLGLLLGLTGSVGHLGGDHCSAMVLKAGSSLIRLEDDNQINLFSGLAPSGSRLNLFAGTDNGFYLRKSSLGYAMRLVNSTSESHAIEVSTGNSSSSTNFIVEHSGRTGIGTDSPGLDYLLDVAGKVRACEVVVSNPGWCDYVFEDNYKLIELEDVEMYIQENGHLPDVPSTQEVEENGISLAQMNAVLLKKVEELTLYSIEQNKAIDFLLNEVELIKNN